MGFAETSNSFAFACLSGFQALGSAGVWIPTSAPPREQVCNLFFVLKTVSSLKKQIDVFYFSKAFAPIGEAWAVVVMAALFGKKPTGKR